ncbi:Putative peptidoglycan binding domain-containing protein [Streptomyces sp. WMMB 714]|uniref:peptidoglycan-binding domain-containing protein n=1 Tax=Streptomyces sp. WMMB 714 TaxID=1286822 RepID=UPI0005F848BC|nr:peptidoglycan-binding domain-containing protein [Streptomyces sp. WMMB 714]SCK18001.1 Putative peptidoglycan binding domain-containing protein [Streptomyces sp. WMMB 714]
MTAHRCCPGCGAELAADGATSCGCVGPFTAEHVDPMHIRPYVDLPEPCDPGQSMPDLEPFARCGTGETAELPAVSPDGRSGPNGLDASNYPNYPNGLHDRDGQYAEDLSSPGAHPEADAAYEPSVSLRAGPGRRRAPGRGGRRRAAAHDDAPKRRRGAVAMAAAGVVAALGAGLLTTQAFTDDDAGDDRSLSEEDRALPEIPSGGPTDSPSRSKKETREAEPSAAPSRTADDPSRADRGNEDPTGRDAVPPAPSTDPGEPGSPDGGGDEGDGGQGRPDRPPRPPQESTQPGGETLRPGDRGEEVEELQRRLKQVRALDDDEPEDGVYSEDVFRAVARFQARNNVRGDRFGEYGPSTRQVLESQTGG